MRLGRERWLLTIQKWLQVFEHIIGQMRKDRAPAPELFEGESRKQDRERGKVFGKPLPARTHQQQRRGQNQKEKRFLRSFAIIKIESAVTHEHRRQRHKTIDQELARVVWVPLVADLGGEIRGRDLHARVLPKQIQVVREVWVNDQPEHAAQRDIGQWPPFETLFRPRDDDSPDGRGQSQQHEHVVSERKYKRQWRQLPMLSLKHQKRTDDEKDNGERRRLRHVEPIEKWR